MIFMWADQYTALAIKKASQSLCRYCVSAIGFDAKGKFLAQARNYPRFHRLGGGVHAEMALLRKSGPKLKSIILCRTNKLGTLKPISPCKNCQRILDKKGIKVHSVTV